MKRCAMPLFALCALVVSAGCLDTNPNTNATDTTTGTTAGTTADATTGTTADATTGTTADATTGTTGTSPASSGTSEASTSTGALPTTTDSDPDSETSTSTGEPDTTGEPEAFFLLDPDYTFSDDFTGSMPSFWDGKGPNVEYGADNPDGPGKCLLFSALAEAGATDGYNWTEQRFRLPVNAAQLEIVYDIWVSPGFQIQPGGASHQKFLILWSGDYGVFNSNCTINCEVWPNYKIGFNWGEDGNNFGHAMLKEDKPFLVEGGGYWMNVHFFISLAEAEGEKGRIIMMKDGAVYSDTATSVFGDEQADLWETQPDYASLGNFIDQGYLMGWQNQPYLVDTFFAIRNFHVRANTAYKAPNYAVVGE